MSSQNQSDLPGHCQHGFHGHHSEYRKSGIGLMSRHVVYDGMAEISDIQRTWSLQRTPTPPSCNASRVACHSRPCCQAQPLSIH